MAMLGSRGPEVKQLSEGTDDTHPLEDVPVGYHSAVPVPVTSSYYVMGTPSQVIIYPENTYLQATKAAQDRTTHGLVTPEEFCISGKQYTVKKLTMRYLIDFNELRNLEPRVFRFRVVSGFIVNNAFTATSYNSYVQHANQLLGKYFDQTKKFGGMGITQEMVIISDKIHQIAPVGMQGSTSTSSEGTVNYASLNGFVDFSRYVYGKKPLRVSSTQPNGDQNLIIDNSKTNYAGRIPFLLVQNLDGMEGKDSQGHNKAPKISYFFAKQYTDY